MIRTAHELLSLKGKTTEKLGVPGRGDGIAAPAAARMMRGCTPGPARAPGRPERGTGRSAAGRPGGTAHSPGSGSTRSRARCSQRPGACAGGS